MAEQEKTAETTQPQQQQVAVHIDERELKTSYANNFMTNGTAEEVMVDFGLNLVRPAPPQEQGGQPTANVVFKLTDRVILNYYTAKRLAITLGQLVRQHEDRFGELKLNVNERSKPEE